MDADGTERERALEARIARLEARLARLEDPTEAARGVVAATPAPAASPSTPTYWQVPGSAQTPPLFPAPSAGRSRLWPKMRLPAPGPLAAEISAQRPSVISAGPAWAAPTIASAPAPEGPDPRASSEPVRSWRTAFPIALPDLSGSFNDIEARLAGRALAWVGGLALVLGAIFFLSLAFSRGWIGPELRVGLGLVAGSVAMAGGGVLLDRGNRLVGHVLTPVGLAVISISLVAATSLYGLIPVGFGLAGALICAVAAAVIAIRSDSQIVALFGLIAVLAAPPLMDATPNLVTLLFVATVLVGTTAVALWRSWPWLPPVAFVLSVLQAAAWVRSDPGPAIGLLGIGVYWLLNIVAAGGEAFRRRRHELSTSSASLLLANVAFVIWAGFSVLSGDLLAYRGFFLVLVAAAHLVFGGYFVVRDGERNLFGLLAIGTGVASLTMAAPVQLGASAVPIAWTAEAVALAWLAARRGHPYSALVSAVLYAMAGGYLVWLYSDLRPTSGVPFADAAGASLGFFMAGVATGLWFARDRSLRSGLAAFGLLIAASCATEVLDPPASVFFLTVLMVVGASVWLALQTLPSAPIAWQTDGLIPTMVRDIGAVWNWRRSTNALLPLAGLLVGLDATARLVGPVQADAFTRIGQGVPFADPAGAALAIYIGGLVMVAWVSGVSWVREPLAVAGLLVTAWACAVELDGVVLVAALAALMVAGLALWRGLAAIPRDPPVVIARAASIDVTPDLFLPAAALLVGSLAAIHVLAIELPVVRFGGVVPPNVPFTDAGAVAALILVVAVLAGGAIVGGARARRVSILFAGGVVAYAIPFEVYAWAVAALWVGLGALALVIGRVDRPARGAFVIADSGLMIAAASVAVTIVADPARLIVADAAVAPLVGLQSIVALGAVVAGFAALAREGRRDGWGRYMGIVSAVTLIHLLSVAVVDIFATQVGGTTGTDELRTQGQVALSVLWAVLGVFGFVAGLWLLSDDFRHGGLALLAVATAKVFLFDLSALDVAYRVISLIALGLLLLASAWLWQRLQPRVVRPAGPAGGAGDPPG